MTRHAVPLAAVLLLAGCASAGGDYPSLAKRPIEGRGFAEPVAAPAVAAADPALDARIATLATRLTATAASFDADLAKVRAQVRGARNARAGSDAWLDAQTGLAALDDRRAETAAVVSDADELASDRAAALQPDYPALTALRARTQTALDGETAAIADLQSGLAPS